MIDASAVVAVVERSGFVEAEHTGTLLVLDGAGRSVVAVGAPDRPIFPRSCLKPLQAVGMLRAGLDVDALHLAVVAASHSGEDVHVALVREILAGAGLYETALRNTPSLPLDAATARAIIRSGGEADRLRQNCSGKHAGMLATCVAAGWSHEEYVDPTHPLQLRIRDTIEDLTGENVAATGVDGCGAPVFAVSPRGLATAYAHLVAAPKGSFEHRVAVAMREHPAVVGGTGRDVTRLMADIPGLLVKDGAEGAAAAVLADGGTVIVKVADGAGRARTPLLVAGLRRLGITASVLDDLASVPVRGGGRVVGAVRAVVGT